MFKKYPGIFFLVSTSLGEDISNLMQEAKDLHKDPETMTGWFHLWLLPHFETLMQQGKLKRGKKEVEIDGKEYSYDGYLDKFGKCHGVGTAINEDGDKYEATWMDDKIHGVCKCTVRYPLSICSHIHCRYFHSQCWQHLNI